MQEKKSQYWSWAQSIRSGLRIKPAAAPATSDLSVTIPTGLVPLKNCTLAMPVAGDTVAASGTLAGATIPSLFLGLVTKPSAFRISANCSSWRPG